MKRKKQEPKAKAISVHFTQPTITIAKNVRPVGGFDYTSSITMTIDEFAEMQRDASAALKAETERLLRRKLEDEG